MILGKIVKKRGLFGNFSLRGRGVRYVARVLTKTRKRLVAKCDTKVRKYFCNKFQKIQKEICGKVSHSEVVELGAQSHSIDFWGSFF